MSPLAIAVMAVICGTVWGGFVTLLALAVMREDSKARTGGAGPRAGG